MHRPRLDDTNHPPFRGSAIDYQGGRGAESERGFIAEELTAPILSELALPGGAPVLLHVNGFGGTPLMELYLMYGAARRIVEGKGATVARALVGNFTTSLDMAGCSLTVTHLDDETMRLWDAPVHTAALRWGC